MGHQLAFERSRKMRVLILSIFLACAAAAPSNIIPAVVPIIPAAIPTLSPGDLQAAAIDAKVKAEDLARSLEDQKQLAADQARHLAELALEQQQEKIEETNAAVKENNDGLFWNVEDKKWQAIDAVKTVEAKLDGAVASNAEAIAKSLTGPVISPINPLIPSFANLVYAPGLIPVAKTEIKDEKLVKTAELGKPEEGKDKPELPKLEGLIAQPVIGAPWIQAPLTLYQPGLLGSPLPLQPVLTQVVKQW